MNLIAVRRDLHLTQVELAIAANVPKYKISLMESGIPILRSFEAKRIELILGLNVGTLSPFIKKKGTIEETQLSFDQEEDAK